MLNTQAASVLTDEIRVDVRAEVAAAIRAKFPIEILRAPTDAQRNEARSEILRLTGIAIRKRGLSSVPYADEQKLADDIASRLLGFGFLDKLLPPARRDISEIALDSFGTLWIKRKGERDFEPLSDMQPDTIEVDTVFSMLFGQQLKEYSEANPSVNATLPRTKDNPGGGRIKFIHPVISQGAGFPSINIRLFEPEPVKPERLLEWKMLDEPALNILAQLVRRGARGLIAGGTSSGKTTMLSMLCNFLPIQSRILTIEDPQEIWIDAPHVVTLQARPVSPGSELKPYLIRDGVDDAMRMTPDFLIVGEVRDGHAAQGLFRAMMSDHPGFTTFHAESPPLVVERVALLLESDTHTSEVAARRMFTAAVDWILQIGFESGRRRVFRLVEVNEGLTEGQVTFNPLVEYDGNLSWRVVGAPQRKRGHTTATPNGWQEILRLDDDLRARFAPVIERRRRAFKAVS